MRQNFIVQFVQLLKHWLCDEQVDIVMEKNWAYSVDWCQRQALQFSVHLINLLNILLRCNGFTRIRPAADHQTVTMTFLLCKFGFGKYFGASSQFNHWASCHIKSTFRHMSQSEKWFVLLRTIREDNTSKMTVFVFWSAQEAPTYQASSPFQYASNAEWPWVVDIEFQDNFLCSCKRISFYDCFQLVVNCQWPATALLIFKILVVSFAKLLEPPLHCVFISSSWAKYVADITSCVNCFMTHFELKIKKMFEFAVCLTSIISIV